MNQLNLLFKLVDLLSNIFSMPILFDLFTMHCKFILSKDVHKFWIRKKLFIK